MDERTALVLLLKAVYIWKAFSHPKPLQMLLYIHTYTHNSILSIKFRTRTVTKNLWHCICLKTKLSQKSYKGWHHSLNNLQTHLWFKCTLVSNCWKLWRHKQYSICLSAAPNLWLNWLEESGLSSRRRFPLLSAFWHEIDAFGSQWWVLHMLPLGLLHQG